MNICKWHLVENFGQNLMKIEDKIVHICPICKGLIVFPLVPTIHDAFMYFLAYLIKSHGAKVYNINNVGTASNPRYNVLIKYKYNSRQENNNMYFNMTSNFNNCASLHCRSCDTKLICNPQAWSSEKAQEFLKIS